MRRTIVMIAAVVAGVGLTWISMNRGPHQASPAPIVTGRAGSYQPAHAAPPVQPTPARRAQTSQVFINERELSREDVAVIARTYGYAPVPGRYWYDTVSGAWGVEGHEAAGFLLPGYDLGAMSPRASNGNTGVFINGREINLVEAARIQQTFGAVYRGRWWLDGRTGNYGIEGNPMPVGNVIAALQSQRNGRGGDNFWCSATACGNDNGQSGYVDVGGTVVGYDH